MFGPSLAPWLFETKNGKRFIDYRRDMVLVFLVIGSVTTLFWQNVQLDDSSQNQARAVSEEVENNVYNNEYKLLGIKTADKIDVSVEGRPVSIQLIGINKFKGKNKRQTECYSKASSKKLAELLKGKKVELENDHALLDSKTLPLRYVIVKDENVNEKLIAAGYAKVPDIDAVYRHQAEFLSAQKFAKQRKLGIWSGKICKQRPHVKTSAIPEQFRQPYIAGHGNSEHPSHAKATKNNSPGTNGNDNNNTENFAEDGNECKSNVPLIGSIIDKLAC